MFFQPTPDLFLWYEKEVLLPYLAEVRATWDVADERAVLVKDGEYEQISMYMTQPDLLNELEKAKLDVC